MPGLAAFFWLRAQDTCRLIALQAGILSACGVAWRGDRGRIGGFLVVGFAGDGRAQIADFPRVFVHQPQVFIRMRFLLPAVMLRVGDGLLGAVAAALRPIKRPIGGALQRQETGSAPARVAVWRHVECHEGARQDGQHVMHPVGGLGLAQIAWAAMHGLQRLGLLRDEDEQPFVFPRWQGAWGPATDSTLAPFAFQGLVRRIQRRIGGRKRREQTRKLCMRQSRRGEKLSRSVL